MHTMRLKEACLIQSFMNWIIEKTSTGLKLKTISKIKLANQKDE